MCRHVRHGSELPQRMGLHEFVTVGQPVTNRRHLASGKQANSARVLVLSRRVPAHGLDVDAVEQPVQLLSGERDHRLRLPGPDEMVDLEPFHYQPKA